MPKGTEEETESFHLQCSHNCSSSEILPASGLQPRPLLTHTLIQKGEKKRCSTSKVLMNTHTSSLLVTECRQGPAVQVKLTPQSHM